MRTILDQNPFLFQRLPGALLNDLEQLSLSPATQVPAKAFIDFVRADKEQTAAVPEAQGTCHEHPVIPALPAQSGGLLISERASRSPNLITEASV